MSRARLLAASLLVTSLAGTAACSSEESHAPATTRPVSSTASPATTSSTTRPATSTVKPSAPVPADLACARRIVGTMSAAQQAGQLLWAGLGTGGSHSLDPAIRDQHLGGVVLLGGWRGSATVAAAAAHVQSRATASATGRVRLFVTADQEGGQVQQLKGAGFPAMPSAHAQNASSAAQLTASSTGWARSLAAAGVNVNLAPVADTVPAALGTGNGPIGRYARQFSSDPADNARMVAAFVRGMHAGQVAATVKHFPGLGRIRENTDTSATGITDTTTTVDDAYLAPFASGIKAGADFVMVGSAIYARIDPGTHAVFSKPIITGLLRTKMGYAGVVVTDDVGAAKAVAAVPVGDRATRFIAAGGDIVLTAAPSTVPAMSRAITARMGSDKPFAAQVTAAATRVLRLKVARGLATCG